MADVPDGYIHIGVLPALEADGQWRYFRGSTTLLASQALLGERIAAKNSLVDEYGQVAFEVWLLIVVDRFLGPGEIAIPDEIAQWAFSFDFKKVLLFDRRLRSAGRVIELRRL